MKPWPHVQLQTPKRFTFTYREGLSKTVEVVIHARSEKAARKKLASQHPKNAHTAELKEEQDVGFLY